MKALLLALLTSTALAQTVETSISTLYTCVDREGVKRLRNYPCGSDERDLDQLKLKTTTVQFGAAPTARVPADPAMTLKASQAAASARVQARSQQQKDRRLAACGEYPTKPRGDNTSKTQNRIETQFALAVHQYDICTVAATTKRAD